MQHIIRKQVIELTVGKNQDAFQLQHRVSKHFYEKIIHLLENVFENISSEDETLAIDRLEIDLGVFDVRKFENGQWTEELEKKITEQIQKSVSEHRNEKDVAVISKPQSICRQWLHYMKFGFLPWNTTPIDGKWYEKVLEAFASDFIIVTELRFIILRNPNALKRIVQQHTENFLKKLTEILTAESQKLLPVIIDELQLVFFRIFYEKKKITAVIRTELKNKVWENVFRVAACDKKNLSALKIAEDILADYAIEIKSNKNYFSDIQTGIKNLAPILEKLIREKPRADKISGRETEKIEQKEIDKSGSKQHEAGFETLQSKAISEGIFIQHAGVVLLHPFLKLFFEHLKLIAAGSFINEKSQQKALYLLHYLATGNTKAEEHELVIAKVLCNYPLQKPVEARIKISKKEIKEADNLLNEAIKQWEKIKGTSIAGLREAFLQRNGKLFMQNEKLHLQLETTSIDVLLDFLPWNLSMIKLPWMKEILRVEWR